MTGDIAERKSTASISWRALRSAFSIQIEGDRIERTGRGGGTGLGARDGAGGDAASGRRSPRARRGGDGSPGVPGPGGRRARRRFPIGRVSRLAAAVRTADGFRTRRQVAVRGWQPLGVEPGGFAHLRFEDAVESRLVRLQEIVKRDVPVRGGEFSHVSAPVRDYAVAVPVGGRTGVSVSRRNSVSNGNSICSVRFRPLHPR